MRTALSSVLRAACDGFQAPGEGLSLHAEIRAVNAASRRIFEAAGFFTLSTEGEVLVYRRAPAGASTPSCWTAGATRCPASTSRPRTSSCSPYPYP